MTNFLDVVYPGSGDMDHDQHQVMDQNQPINDILTTTFQHIISKDYYGVSFSGGSRVIALVNGLGSTPLIEVMIIAGKATLVLEKKHGLTLDILYAGSFMTTLEKSGFSISIIRSDPYILRRIVFRTSAPSLPYFDIDFRYKASCPEIIPESPLVNFYKNLEVVGNLTNEGLRMKLIVNNVCTGAIELKEQLDEFEKILGDGDICGSNLCRVAQIVKMSWNCGVAALKKYYRFAVGCRTALDAILPTVTVLQEELVSGSYPDIVFRKYVDAAMKGAKYTQFMLSKVGMISPEIQKLTPDPGDICVAELYNSIVVAALARSSSGNDSS
ncbi:putative 3,4-dihydroxy-2-butanone kinase [Lotus japonicus]|uniref:putative 3,4-dihydroxy-2-butanone kinase n=1 Tax=Lotus japonicus TaxID=34305 RepID=UPI002589B216|nr:putative 3,4-dihydroxy-2-butanone kinase [Lotus japonicus]